MIDMTGLDRLRELADDIFEKDLWASIRGGMEDKYGTDVWDDRTVNCLLCEIADQIEAEQEERVTRRMEDREAAEWVRAHGGLDHMKSEWRSRSNLKRQLEKAQAKVERQQRHIEFVQGKCRERQGRICELSKKVEEMRPRLMPEGCEWLLEVWPKWSNGEYCKFGDWWKSGKYGVHEPKKLRKLSIYTPEQLDEWGQGDGESYGYEWDFTRPSDPKHRPDKVEPPAPAVIAADGEPLEVGQTVWEVATGEEYAVVDIYHGTTEPDFPLHCVKCERDGDVVSHMFEPLQLTHTKPEPHDTWDQIKADADLCPFNYAYARKCGKQPEQSNAEFQRKDLVRRCKALAERGETK